MEKIVKCLIISILLICAVGCAQPTGFKSLERIEKQHGLNKMVISYADQIVDPILYSTYEPNKYGVDIDKINIYFHSEVKDVFRFYLNDEYIKTISIDTTVDGEGNYEVPEISLSIPNLNSELTLKVVSIRYGSFVTSIKKKYPMLYVKHFNNKWYLEHNTVYKLGFDNFLFDN
jgi:hypothetical protein